jgi:hypothetical protein
VRLDPLGEHLETLDAAEVTGWFAAHEAEQAAHPLITEILDVTGIGVERVPDLVVVHRRADADPRVEAAAGQDVDRRQVLGQP